MSIFYHDEHQLDFSEFDMFKRLKMSTILKFLTGFAGLHYIKLGLTHDFLWERGMVFLISRASVKIHRQLYESEKIRVGTYENGARGAIFRRNFMIQNENGDLAISAKTTWILCEPASRRILRPKSFMPYRQIEEHPEIHLDCEEAGKINIPKNMEFTGQRKIVYSDIDVNGHVYNATYSDISCDCLPLHCLEAGVKAFQIHFQHEAKYGDSLQIYTKQKNNTYYIKGDLEEQSSYHMRIEI